MALVFKPVTGGHRMATPLSDSPLTRTGRTVDKAQRGGLPAPSDKAETWAGPGSDRECSGCEEKIERSEHEFAIAFSETLAFRFHGECHTAWLAFSAGREGARLRW
jgi:hypothetical protein